MNREIVLPSHNVSISLIMDAVARCSVKDATLEEIVSYTGKSVGYVKSAILSALVLEMLIDSNGKYSCNKLCSDELLDGSNDEYKLEIFKKWLQKWEPYMLFVKYLSFNDSIETAVRKICSFYKFNVSQKAVGTLFLNWGKSSGILDNVGKVKINTYNILDMTDADKMKEDSNIDCGIRLYLIEALSDKVYSYLNVDEIDELVTSLLKYDKEPRIAIECAGRAYEDFLRRICLEINLDVQKMNGISQVANFLYSSKDDMGNKIFNIHSKQYNISQGIGDMRNMAGHSKEAKTMERWELTEIGALSMITSVIANIKSIYNYVLEKKYLY